MSTHDGEGRAASRWCGGDDAAIRCALLVLLGLEGTSILYYGDEIGMLEPRCDELEAGHRYRADERCTSRTPMPWARGGGGGFSAGPAWLPVGDTARANVADQMADPASVLHFCRDLIRVRSRLSSGRMRMVSAPMGVLAWRRGDATVAVNLGTTSCDVPAEGSIVVSTKRDREGSRVKVLSGVRDGRLFCVVGRIALAHVSDAALVETMGRLHEVVDRRMPIVGVIGIVGALASIAFSRVSWPWALSAVAAQVLWIVVYRSVAAPVNAL